MNRKLSLLVLAACAVVVVIATLAEPRYPELGTLIWPGAGLSFLVSLVLHIKYFDHAALLTLMDVLFNTLIYWGILTGLTAIYRRLGKNGSARLR